MALTVAEQRPMAPGEVSSPNLRRAHSLAHCVLVLSVVARPVAGFSTVTGTRQRTPRRRRGCRLPSTPHGDDDKLEQLREKYLSGRRPEDVLAALGASSTNRPAASKSDVYDEGQLADLLELHNRLHPLAAEKQEQRRKKDPVEFLPSLHDTVLQAVSETDEGKALPIIDDELQSAWLTDSIRAKLRSVTAIASDVDGTLVAEGQVIHPRTADAVRRAIQLCLSPDDGAGGGSRLRHFFPATGKTRAGAIASLGPELGDLVARCPGVFCQGLYCVLGDGRVVFEKKLPPRAVEAAEALVGETGTSIVAYDGDDLYTTEATDSVVGLHEIYGEPMAREVPAIAAHDRGVHKILILHEDAELLTSVVRPQLEALAQSHDATVTQALPTMLELLPGGCSKARGVRELCAALGINPGGELLALGDAENDVGMLEMAAVGVCVANGSALAQGAADAVVGEPCDRGGAGLVVEAVLGRQQAS